MAVKTCFLFISNILGLNFTNLLAPIKVIIIFQVLAVGYGFYISIYWKISHSKELTKDFYYILDTIQIEVVYVISLIFVLRAFWKRSLQGNILSKMERITNCLKNSRESERTFLSFVLLLISSRTLKFLLGRTIVATIYTSKSMFSELIFASSDFMFAFYVMQLRKCLRSLIDVIQNNNCMITKDLREKLLYLFSIKKDIQSRYAFELFLSISYNFVQLIMSFYWFSMRVKFNRLSTSNGK